MTIVRKVVLRIHGCGSWKIKGLVLVHNHNSQKTQKSNNYPLNWWFFISSFLQMPCSLWDQQFSGWRTVHMWDKINLWTTQIEWFHSLSMGSPPHPLDLSNSTFCTFTHRWQSWNWFLPVSLFITSFIIWSTMGSVHKVYCLCLVEGWDSDRALHCTF